MAIDFSFGPEVEQARESIRGFMRDTVKARYRELGAAKADEKGWRAAIKELRDEDVLLRQEMLAMSRLIQDNAHATTESAREDKAALFRLAASLDQLGVRIDETVALSEQSVLQARLDRSSREITLKRLLNRPIEEVQHIRCAESPRSPLPERTLSASMASACASRVFPEPGGPMIMYQGSADRALPPSFDFLSAAMASSSWVCSSLT